MHRLLVVVQLGLLILNEIVFEVLFGFVALIVIVAAKLASL